MTEIPIITSLDDPRLGPFRDLKTTNLTRWSGQFIAEGAEVVRRLLASDLTTESVLVKHSFLADWTSRVPPSVPLLSLPDDLAQDVAGFNFHQGVLACGRRPEHQLPRDAGQLLSGPIKLAALDRVTDPDNVGSLIRLARAFGLSALILGPGCADPWSRRVVRVSMGTIFSLPVFLSDDLPRDLTWLAANDVTCAAACLTDEASTLSNFQPPESFCIVLGNERHGVSPETLAACGQHVMIPMAPGADSLNVAVAAGIFFHHFLFGGG